jgi:hypothetical protein
VSTRAAYLQHTLSTARIHIHQPGVPCRSAYLIDLGRRSHQIHVKYYPVLAGLGAR